MNVRVLGLTLVAVAIGFAPALAIDPAGQAVAVDLNASATGTGGSRALQSSAAIFMGDRIVTDAKGEAQLRFVDNTRMIVGPNSNLAIDKFVVSGPASAQQVTIDAVKGAFRFITGSAPKQAYEINTPVATISVRGTVFDFASGPDGIAIMLYREADLSPSSVQWCEKQPVNSRAQPKCYELSEACSLILIPMVGDYRFILNVYERTAMAKDLFPFLNKRGVLKEFDAASADCDHVDRTQGGYSVPGADAPEDKEPAATAPKCNRLVCL